MKSVQNRGIGLLTAVALLTVVALGIVIAAPVVYQVIASDNTVKTSNNLQFLKTALAGNPRLLIQGVRADYGFIGTMGTMPPDLSKLWLAGVQPTYSFNSSKKVGAGWVGPYIPNIFVEDLLALDKDLFGQPLVYTSTPFTRPIDNQVVAVRIESVGADGVASTSDDMLIDILKGEIFSTVTGTLKRGTQAVPFATVTLNLPINGVVSARTAVTDSNGTFTFTDVPFGFRSISVDPKLTFEPNSASVKASNTLQFTVTNYAPDDVTITSLTATYAGSLYYEGIRVGNDTVFDYSAAPYNGTRGQSGQQITFSQTVLVGGSGKPTQVIPIRVDQEVTTTPDLLIRGVGRSVVIQLQNFKNIRTGTASNVSPSGVSFTINFSDGSQNTFTVP
jgi:hypothetical protein